ncbi:MAG: fasciclin domain-containing protein [Gemmatimonadaceae bacterium]|nr:fasciclin domain-containing protein [Gemmatimonadaceae bacterium]
MDSAAPAAAPAMAGDAAMAPKDLIETAASAGSFNTLAQALNAAGLVETLKGAGPYTILAPTDEAFAKIPQKDLEALLANKEELTKVLKYHVISGNVPSSEVATMTDATTLEGSKITIKAVDGKVTLNGKADVTSPDITASNGTIHVINTVLMPPKK